MGHFRWVWIGSRGYDEVFLRGASGESWCALVDGHILTWLVKVADFPVIFILHNDSNYHS